MVYFLRMRINISPKLLQKTVLAPVMQQSIEVLLLPVVELNQLINQELQENPLLEVSEEKPFSEQLNEIMFYQNQRSSLGRAADVSPSSEEDEQMEERPVSKETPLEDYLYQQMRLEITDPEEVRIGEYIVGNLDENGYFHSSLDEAATILSANVEQIRKVLNVIQNFEPLGIAACDIKECLSIQAHYLFTEEDGALAERIIMEHLEDLGHKRYAEIARQLGVPAPRIKDVAKLIASLDPKPARKFRPIEDNIYVKPDVIVTVNNNGEFEVQSIHGNFPPLRISSYYQGLLQQKNLSEEERTFIQEKVRNAVLFMRSIEQRQETILAIAKYIVEYQKEFFQEAGQGVLKPMVLRDVAGGIDRNESTVSRAINNKYMDTPFGIFSMKYFFSQAVADNNSNRSIQEEIKSLIEQEDKASPMSDHDIQQYFARKGVNIARRTINKYRKNLHILPSHLRKN